MADGVLHRRVDRSVLAFRLRNLAVLCEVGHRFWRQGTATAFAALHGILWTDGNRRIGEPVHLPQSFSGSAARREYGAYKPRDSSGKGGTITWRLPESSWSAADWRGWRQLSRSPKWAVS